VFREGGHLCQNNHFGPENTGTEAHKKSETDCKSLAQNRDTERGSPKNSQQILPGVGACAGAGEAVTCAAKNSRKYKSHSLGRGLFFPHENKKARSAKAQPRLRENACNTGTKRAYLRSGKHHDLVDEDHLSRQRGGGGVRSRRRNANVGRTCPAPLPSLAVESRPTLRRGSAFRSLGYSRRNWCYRYLPCKSATPHSPTSRHQVGRSPTHRNFPIFRKALQTSGGWQACGVLPPNYPQNTVQTTILIGMDSTHLHRRGRSFRLTSTPVAASGSVDNRTLRWKHRARTRRTFTVQGGRSLDGPF